MSQGSQGAFAAGRIILPLSKFSYATVHGESITPIPWIHLGRTNNLFVIIETQRVEDSNRQPRDLKKFKVLQDPDVLEDIDLDVLASEANRARLEAQDPRMNGKIPSVTVIVKVPCIAIRYPLEGGQIRRIQIRLASNNDYYEVLKTLTRAGVPFGDAGVFPTQQPPTRPFSSSSSLLRPSDSASQLGVRPVSVSSNMGNLSSILDRASAGWASASSLRPSTGSEPVGGSFSVISNYFGQPSRNAGLADQLGISFNKGPGLNNSGDGLVSGYFGEKIQPHHTQSHPASALGYPSTHSSIDLYQPRPSTAPVFDGRTLEQLLPPKRQLPFPIPTPAKRARKATVKPDVEIDGDLAKSLPDLGRLRTSVPDAVSAMEGMSQVSEHSAATVPPMKGKHVAASRASRPRAPKKQQAKALAKKASKAVMEEEPVPSAEQLFKQTEDYSKKTIEISTTIDTQALLSIVEATRPYQSVELLEVSKKPVAPLKTPTPSSQARKCNCCRLRKGKCNGEDPCDWCTDINAKCMYDVAVEPELQVLVPSSQPEVVAELPTEINATTHKEKTGPPGKVASRTKAIVAEVVSLQPAAPEDQATQEGPTQEPELSHSPHARNFDTDTILIGAAPSTPKAGTPTSSTNLHLSAEPGPLALLLREAAFAESNRLTTWANLPEPDQRRTLDTWMCQQLADPGFVALVKRLDESWQANLFGRSVGVEL